MYTKDYASIVPRVVLGEGINSYGTTADTCTWNSVKQFKACCSKCVVYESRVKYKKQVYAV